MALAAAAAEAAEAAPAKGTGGHPDVSAPAVAAAAELSEPQEPTFFKEAAEAQAHVEAACASLGEGAEAEVALRSAAAAFARYQEFPQLLDAHLEAALTPLMSVVRGVAREQAKAQAPAQAHAQQQAAAGGTEAYVCGAARAGLRRTCVLVAAIAKVRGAKTVVRFLPREAADLEPALRLLGSCHSQEALRAAEAEGEGDSGVGNGGLWETRCVLLLWLSILVLIPFDLAVVDSALLGEAASGADTGAGSENSAPPVVRAIVARCTEYLGDSGWARDVAASLLGKLLTRPGSEGALSDFVQWARGTLEKCAGAPPATPREAFAVCGAAHALACIFKSGRREALLPYARGAWAAAGVLLAGGAGAAGGTLARLLATKLAQRVALVALRPTVAPWRYQRGCRSLEANLVAAAGEAGADTTSPSGAKPQAAVAAGTEADGDDEDFEMDEVAEELLEEVIEALLSSLRDKDTVVRWSAAKGLGRITGRLPSSLADDIVGSVLELLSPIEGDGAWHGACLAVAELARRGLLLPARLPEATPLVATALAYDVRRGAHSVGSHVRDAAAYCCWAFARAYAPDIMADHIRALAPPLIVAACLDRELHCRRAAAAAYQECVGRLRNVPDGLALVRVVDYFAVGQRQVAYLDVARQAAAFEAYRRALLEHALRVTLPHWEATTRRLASLALARLAELDPEWASAVALPELCARCLSKEIIERHGAVIGVAELLPALKDAGAELPAEVASKAAALVGDIEKARLYRGKGGELMRAAVCRLVGGSAEARLPLKKSAFEGHLATISEALRHPSDTVRAAAAAALPPFCEKRLLDGDRCIKVPAGQSIANTFVGMVREENVAARRGGALALAALSPELLAPHGERVLEAVGLACHLEEDPDERDAESRAAAARSLATLVASLPSLVERARAVVADLLVAMEDYSIDNRGDVGSWVREAALVSLERVAAQLLAAGELPDELALRCLGSLARQSAGRIDKVRAAAAERLVALAEACAARGVATVTAEALLAALPGRGRSVTWTASAAAFPAISPALAVADLRPPLLEGLLASAGGAADSLGTAARTALAEALKGGDGALRVAVAAEAAAVLERGGGPSKAAAAPMRAVEGLISARALDGGADAVWSARVAAAVKTECAGCRDVQKLMAAVSLLCALVGLRPACADSPSDEDLVASRQAFRQLSVLLVNRFPRVRRHASEQMYSRLLCVAPEDLGVEEDALDEAIDLLGDTRWDGDVTSVRATRDDVCRKVKVEPPTRKARGEGAPKKEAKAEHEYAALVNEAGY